MSRMKAMWSPGTKFGRADASETTTVPSGRIVCHSSRTGPPLMYSAQSVLHVLEPLGRQELVEVAADQVALGDADQVAAGRVDVDIAAVVVGDEDRVERGVEDRAQLLLVLAQDRLGALADDRRGHEARSGAEGVELGGAPDTLGDAVVEADEAPPAPSTLIGTVGDRADALRVEDLPLVFREVADVAA